MIGIIILLGWTKNRRKKIRRKKGELKRSLKKFDSPVNMSIDHQQNDCESQSSGEENEWDEKETAETALKAVSDAPEPVKTTLSATVPEVEWGLSPHMYP